MALKVVDPDEIVEFIPTSERKEKLPTTVYHGRMSKKQYDAYINSLSEIRKNKVVSKYDKAAETLFRTCLRQKNGAFILNGYVDKMLVTKITDLDKAVEFLLGVQDIEAINEIELSMRGQSELNEDDEKNSVGQSGQASS